MKKIKRKIKSIIKYFEKGEYKEASISRKKTS
jgi:hypothetical protein